MRLGFEAGLKEASKRLQTCRNVLLGSVEAWLKPASRRPQTGLKLAETFY